MSDVEPCLVCNTPCQQTGGPPMGITARCPRCGEYYLAWEARMALVLKRLRTPEKELAQFGAVGSHVVRRLPHNPSRYRMVTQEVLEEIVRHGLPTPEEQADNLIVWLGSELRETPAGSKQETALALISIVGAPDTGERRDNLEFILSHLIDKQLISRNGLYRDDQGHVSMSLSLTFSGWDRFGTLEKAVSERRIGKRHLGAVLVTDIVGSTKLMAADEAGAVAAFKALQAKCEEIAASFGGRVVKGTGDGTLSEYSSAFGALQAAFAIYRAVHELNLDEPPERRIELRAGLTVGDLHASEDADILGNAVNLASRLQEVAAPGTICLPAFLRDELEPSTGFTFKDLGLKALKNMPRKVHVFQVAPASTDAPPRRPQRRFI